MPPLTFDQVKAAAVSLCKRFEEGDPLEWITWESGAGYRWECYFTAATAALEAAGLEIQR